MSKLTNKNILFNTFMWVFFIQNEIIKFDYLNISKKKMLNLYVLDSFLRSRTQHDHEATAMMKAQFMMLWDGLSTDPENTVIVMGATNRPRDLDPAILRRMPSTFEISLPVNIYHIYLYFTFNIFQVLLLFFKSE